jgi:hypothetical protein
MFRKGVPARLCNRKVAALRGQVLPSLPADFIHPQPSSSFIPIYQCNSSTRASHISHESNSALIMGQGQSNESRHNVTTEQVSHELVRSSSLPLQPSADLLPRLSDSHSGASLQSNYIPSKMSSKASQITRTISRTSRKKLLCDSLRFRIY